MVALNARRIGGAAGSGKTAALLDAMYQSAQAGVPRAAIALVIPAGPSLVDLRERLRALDPQADEFRVFTFPDLALHLIELETMTRGAAMPRVIDDVEAADVFAAVASAALELGPLDTSSGELDPEVSGLRSPERFCGAAFALIAKLRSACIDAEEFERICLRGAATFYANPPNFSDIDLLLATKDTQRASLSVDATELERQRQREIDLAKILGALYRASLQHFGRQTLAMRDLVPEALARLRADVHVRAQARASLLRLYIDDAQECTVAEFELVRELCGEDLSRLTFVFDDKLTIGAFSGARPRQWLALPAEETARASAARSPQEIVLLAADFVTRTVTPQTREGTSALTIFHAMQKADEAAFIADRVAKLLDEGAAQASIAIILRTLQGSASYERALLARGIALDVEGDVSPLRNAAATDALAALWVACDPYRHAWLLRFLQAAPFAFPDSTLAVLCGDAPSPQGSLFEGEPAAPSGSGVDRSVRLGRHVFGADVDARLPGDACAKLAWLRQAASGWHELRERASLVHFAARVFEDVGLPVTDTNAAQRDADARAIERLFTRIERYELMHPGARLEDFLEHAQSLGTSEHARTGDGYGRHCVQLLSVAAARGRSFDHVFIANLHAGAFPRYYTPESFLFSPSLGIIAKDNAGGTHAARTAKYTYYDFRYKPAAAYYEHERHMLALAMLRARSTLTVTACERPTRGIGAPEFLTELRTLRPASADSFRGDPR